MLNNIRYKIALILVKKAGKLIDKGGYKNTIKGLKYIKISLSIVPYSKELSVFGKEMRRIANEHNTSLES